MVGRRIVRFALALAGVIVGAARAQSERPIGPAPPIHQVMLCAIPFEKLLAAGVDGGAGVDAPSTMQIVEALYRQERYQVLAQIEDELGPLAWSLFVPGEPNAAEMLFTERSAGACMDNALARGSTGADAVARARSQELVNRYAQVAVLADGFFMDGAGGADAPESEVRALRLELPPSELMVAGELLAGRVVLDEPGPDGAAGTPVETLAEGLLVEVAGQTARVGREGLFALRAPVRPGTFTVEVRHQTRPLLVPVEATFTIARRDGETGAPGAGASESPTATDLPRRPEVDCPGFDRFLDAMVEGDSGASAPAECPIATPRVLLPEERLLILGRLGNRSGRATRAFVGPWEVPLLARTPIAAVFDASEVPAGLHVLALYEGADLLAMAPVRRLRLVASSDRPQLGRGESATFDVRVAGLPRSPSQGAAPTEASARPVAFLDYVNRSPKIGKFRDRPDRFSVAITSASLTPEEEPPAISDQQTLLARIEAMVSMSAGGGDTAAAREPEHPPSTVSGATSESGAFVDQQRYVGTDDGEYHVQVSVRLAEETASHAAAIVAAGVVPSDLASALTFTGSDERGAFAAIDGRRLYLSPGAQQRGVAAASTAGRLEGPQATRLYDASCSGVCRCSIQSWNHSAEVGAQVAALDRTRPEWRTVTATAEACGEDPSRAACYGLLSLECNTRCKRYFESTRTDHVSGFADDPALGAPSDRAACDR